MNAPSRIGIPDEARLIDVARYAAARQLHLLCDGRRVALSPTPLRGWTEIHVLFKPAPPRGVSGE
jgi:hypothetical protein